VLVPSAPSQRDSREKSADRPAPILADRTAALSSFAARIGPLLTQQVAQLRVGQVAAIDPLECAVLFQPVER